jgi:hypothetical protein
MLAENDELGLDDPSSANPNQPLPSLQDLSVSDAPAGVTHDEPSSSADQEDEPEYESSEGSDGPDQPPQVLNVPILRTQKRRRMPNVNGAATLPKDQDDNETESPPELAEGPQEDAERSIDALPAAAKSGPEGDLGKVSTAEQISKREKRRAREAQKRANGEGGATGQVSPPDVLVISQITHTLCRSATCAASPFPVGRSSSTT